VKSPNWHPVSWVAVILAVALAINMVVSTSAMLFGDIVGIEGGIDLVKSLNNGAYTLLGVFIGTMVKPLASALERRKTDHEN
jgi:hypothetical protein